MKTLERMEIFYVAPVKKNIQCVINVDRGGETTLSSYVHNAIGVIEVDLVLDRRRQEI